MVGVGVGVVVCVRERKTEKGSMKEEEREARRTSGLQTFSDAL